jgi:hypothetical protein
LVTYHTHTKKKKKENKKKEKEKHLNNATGGLEAKPRIQ